MFFLLLLASRTAFGTSLSAVGTFPADLTTRDALFDAAVELLRNSGFPPTVTDRERGLIESSVTQHNTMSAASISVAKVTMTWKVVIDKAPDGSLRLAADRATQVEPDQGLVPGPDRRMLTQFFRNLAVGVGVGAPKVILTLEGETKPLSEWTKRRERSSMAGTICHIALSACSSAPLGGISERSDESCVGLVKLPGGGRGRPSWPLSDTGSADGTIRIHDQRNRLVAS